MCGKNCSHKIARPIETKTITKAQELAAIRVGNLMQQAKDVLGQIKPEDKEAIQLTIEPIIDALQEAINSSKLVKEGGTYNA